MYLDLNILEEISIYLDRDSENFLGIIYSELNTYYKKYVKRFLKKSDTISPQIRYIVHIYFECIRDNIKDGKYVSFGNFTSKDFIIVAYYKNNLKDGEMITFMNNNIYSKTNYNFGIEQGKRYNYFLNGKLRSIEDIENDFRNGLQLIYDRDGYLEEENILSWDRKLGNFKTYYNNGNIYTKGFYDEKELLSDTYIEYFENGNIKEIGEYYFGVKIGMWKEYYNNKNIKSIISYKDGLKNGEYKEYYKNGKVKLYGKYFNNYRLGKFTSFDKNGNEDSVTYYTPIEYATDIDTSRRNIYYDKYETVITSFPTESYIPKRDLSKYINYIPISKRHQ